MSSEVPRTHPSLASQKEAKPGGTCGRAGWGTAGTASVFKQHCILQAKHPSPVSNQVILKIGDFAESHAGCLLLSGKQSHTVKAQSWNKF